MSKKQLNKYRQFVQDHLVGKDMIKLIDTTEVSAFNPEVQEMLNSFYESPIPDNKKMGSIINSIYTQQSSVFLMSYRILNDLLRNDPNIEVNSCHSTNYKHIMFKLFIKEMINTLRESGDERAGLYEFTSPLHLGELEKEIGRDTLRVKKEEYLKWYDRANNLAPVDLEKQAKLKKCLKEAKEEASERRKINNSK